MIQTIDLHLIENLQCVRESLWDIGEDRIHLLLCLKPLLFRVQHSRRVIQVLASRQAQQMVMCLCILLIHKVSIIRTDKFDTILTCQFYQHLIGFLLQRERLTIGTDVGVRHLMTLELEIIVIAKKTMIPLYRLTGSSDITLQNLMRHLAGDTGRADNQSLMVSLQIGTICTRPHIIAVHPGVADQFDQVLIAFIVLGKHDQVIATHILLATPQLLGTITRHIHLTAKDGFERLQALLLTSFVDTSYIIMELLDTEHVAMIGNRHASHAVTNRLVHQFLDTRLTIQYRVISMYV